MQTKRHVAPFVVMALLFFATFARAETLHVPKQYATIQTCIDAAVKGDECVVAPGTYNEAIDFLGKTITVRSAGGAEVTTISAAGIGGSVVSCANGEGPDSVLNGFTITGGNVYGSFADSVGVMYRDSSSSTVTNCTFSGNTALASPSKYQWDRFRHLALNPSSVLGYTAGCGGKSGRSVNR